MFILGLYWVKLVQSVLCVLVQVGQLSLVGNDIKVESEQFKKLKVV